MLILKLFVKKTQENRRLVLTMKIKKIPKLHMKLKPVVKPHWTEPVHLAAGHSTSFIVK